MKTKQTETLTAAQRERLRVLVRAARGCDWGSPELETLASYYRSLGLPWWVGRHVGANELHKHRLGIGDVEAFTAGMAKLTRISDYGQPERCGACAPCRRRAELPLHVTVQQQQEFEAQHGPMACEREPRFEER